MNDSDIKLLENIYVQEEQCQPLMRLKYSFLKIDEHNLNLSIIYKNLICHFVA